MEGKLNLPGSTEGSFRQLAFELEAEARRHGKFDKFEPGKAQYSTPNFLAGCFL